VQRLLRRPYWRRVWVLQEVVVARVVQVVCGYRWLPFEVFVQAIAALKRKLLEDLENSDSDSTVPRMKFIGPYPLERMIELREQRTRLSNIQLSGASPSGPITFLDFLVSCQNLESSDPRDRIYGLLGLETQATNYKRLVKVSYSKTSETLFCEVARALIEEDKTLRTISLACNMRSLGNQQLSLPSWVPNWTCKEQMTLLYLGTRGPFKNTNTYRVDIMQHVRFSSNCRILSAQGFVHDTISTVHPSWSLDYGLNMEVLSETLRNRTLPNGLPMIQAFFHAISTNWDFLSDLPLWESPQTSLAQAYCFLTSFVADPSSAEGPALLMSLARSFFERPRPDFQLLIEMILTGDEDMFSSLPLSKALAPYHLSDWVHAHGEKSNVLRN
jgi:hypothetical protein